MDRCLNRNEKYEKKRFCVQVKWFNLADDIIECMNNKVKDTIKDYHFFYKIIFLFLTSKLTTEKKYKKNRPFYSL